MWQKRLARGGERHFAARPREQGVAELALERGNLMAERGLHDVALLGRAREVFRLGNRHDVPELLKFHGSIVNHD
ncbi:hypothetical protein GCM10009693_20520 [Leucobacter chromiireducens subsp. chromiireducens]